MFSVTLGILRSRITGSHGNSMFNFFRNCQTLFQNGCKNPIFLPIVFEGSHLILFFFFLSFCLFAFSRAIPAAYGGSQARGTIRAVANSLCHSHSNTVSEPHLRPTPQLAATPDPQPTEQGQGTNLQPHGS